MFIIFDVDDTLYDLMQAFAKAHKEIFGEKGDQALEEKEGLEGLTYYKKLEWLFQRSRYHSEHAFYRWSKGEISEEEEFRYRVVETYKELGIAVSNEVADHFKDRYRYYQKHIQAFPGIRELLERLSSTQVQLAILTNGNHKGQLNKVLALSVTDLISLDSVFISGDLPAPKPDLKAFRYVEEALGIQEGDRDQVWYIGDNYDVDVVGAKAAGWHAIWFNHRGRSLSQETHSVADLEVRSVADLERALLSLIYQGNHYYSLNQYLKQEFGEKVYKLALDGSMTCPNRDGSLGTGGCIFCSEGGSGEFAQKQEASIEEQIQKAKERIQQKTDAGRFIAYFQSYTNTYAPVSRLREVFLPAISHPEVVALSIGTRPDCLPEEVLELLEELNQIKPVWVELGLQTIHQDTADYIRRGYQLPVYEAAVKALHDRGIQVITHVILGLPGEDKERMLETISYLGQEKRTDGIKLQLLHVLEGTDLAADYKAGRFQTLSMEEYFDILEEALCLLPPDMVIHRLTGDGAKKLLLAPEWSGNKKQVLNQWNRRLKERCIYQGSAWTPSKA